jgi:Ca2+-binding EF-hand superfamily protein
MGVEELKV